MTALSKELKLGVEEQRELNESRSLKSEFSSAKEKIRELEGVKVDLEKKLASTVHNSASISIENGEVFSVVPNEVLMAVLDTRPATKTCVVRLGGNSEWMDLGTALNGDFGGVGYRFILTKVSRDSCEFLYSKME